MKFIQKAGIILCAALFSTLCAVPSNAAIKVIGDGDMYIESKSELLEFLIGDKINRNRDTYYLAEDIDLGGDEITPLRINEGIFDGQGHTISNFKISRSTKKGGNGDDVGLICFNRGIIRNLKIENASVTGYYCVGALCGSNNAKVSAGQTPVIENCSVSNVSVTGYNNVGALAGNNVSDGKKDGAKIVGCSATNNINVSAYMTSGSFIGFNRGYINNCTLNCTNTSYSVRAKKETGGFIGENEGVIYNCVSNGNAYVQIEEAGGFVGDNDGTVSNCTATGFTYGGEQVGGFAGSMPGIIRGCTASGNVTSTKKGSAYVGGFVGLDDKGRIYSSKALGNVTAKGTTVGGFVGMCIYSKSAFSGCTVGTKTSQPIIKGAGDVGGFVGINTGSRGNVSIKKCTSYAQVYGGKNTGGFVGKNFSSRALISLCASNGKVKGKANTGAFVGYNANGGKITKSKKNATKVIGKKTKFAGKNRGKIKN